MQHIIIGTAGHIDHGKTALIKELTGFEGDTSQEEKRRGITIELSFSSLQNKEKNIAFIDVPGHEKLIKNMIAGAFGFDSCLVVVDANEGIMPQTIEHLQILNLLKIQNIVLALTKKDLATQEQISSQEIIVSKYINSLSNIKSHKIIPVSIYDKESIQNIKNELFKIEPMQRKSNNLFRYYVDRSFNITGAGKVVTGTILDGTISVGDRIFDTTHEKELTIRNLQVHDKDVQTAFISQRVAINLQNSKELIKKGVLFSKKGYMKGFNTIDVWMETINNRILKHNSNVVFFIGTKQIEAKVLLFDNTKEFSKGFAKIEFKEKVYAVFNEAFIISISSKIICGGRVLNPINDPIKKAKKRELLESLYENDFNKAFNLLIDVHKKGFGLISSVQRFGLNHNDALNILKKDSNIFIDEKALVVYPMQTSLYLRQLILDIYKKNQYALLSAKSISLKIKWASEALIISILNNLLKEKIMVLENGIYKNANIKIDDINSLIKNKIYEILDKSFITPDAPYNIYDELDIDRQMGDNALKNLTSSKKVIRLAHNLFITYSNLLKLMKELKIIIKEEGYIDIKIFKEHYTLSRKYIIAYLEHLDNQIDIRTDGMKRKLV